MATFADNPFTLLSLIAAPAVLTNASSVLALGTSNRFARAIDRARALSAQLESQKPDDPNHPDAEWKAEQMALRFRQLGRVERRSILLLNALTSFYSSLGSFAAASLVSLLGAGIAATGRHDLAIHILLGIALVAGFWGVGGLVYGTFLLVRETRLAVANLKEEAAVVRKRHHRILPLEAPSD
ncbi:MAG: DUF2721 domain-containing protein [Capsulimonas sp.]|uniref:DUF2721 domain-containing protein n=1 Tax=Capsulimonas sp. TaxID=2494211 RepID=UPI003263290A